MINSVQGSISVRRLRNGDTIFLTLETPKPLFQAVDEQDNIVPDWTVEANRPVITPNCTTTRGRQVTYQDNSLGWQHNGAALTFNGAMAGAYRMDASGKFGINPTTGALKIFANLASAVNTASDTLTFSCIAIVDGVEYSISKSIEVQIVKGGSNSYYGFIAASTKQLGSATPESTLSTQLWLGSNQISDYSVKWYADDTLMGKSGKTIVVDREDVGGTQLFRAEFYVNPLTAESVPVDLDAIRIIDTADEFSLVPYISSDRKEVEDGPNGYVVVKARLVNNATGAVISPANPTWTFHIYDGTTWLELDRLAGDDSTDSVRIGAAHTDQEDGTFHDIEVIVELDFED